MLLAGAGLIATPFAWAGWVFFQALTMADAASRATFLARAISEAMNSLALGALAVGAVLAVVGAVLLRRRDPRGSLGPPTPTPGPIRRDDAWDLDRD